MVDQAPVHPKVTLRDIAREVGFSHVTVSLALRNHPKIPEARRRQIQSAAKRLGYCPNTNAVALSLHKSGTKDAPAQASLAWLNPGAESNGRRWREEFNWYRQRAAVEAKQLGYRLEELVLPAPVSETQMSRLIGARQASGILFLLPPETRTWLQTIFSLGDNPLVCLGRGAAPCNGHFVAADDLQNAAAAFTQIWSRGYRRIGLAIEGGSTRSRFARAGFLHAVSNQHNAPILPPLMLCGEKVKDRVSCATWLRRYRPDAVLLENRMQFEQLRTALGPFATTGVALLDVPEGAEGKWSGTYRNHDEIVRVAVQTLAAGINDEAGGRPHGAHQILIEGRWTDGASLPLRR